MGCIMSNDEHKRDWRAYNEELVVRGEFYLDFGFVTNWNRELTRDEQEQKRRTIQIP